MKVLVTGATGFIGWHAAARLREAGHSVRVLARDPEKAKRLLAPLGIGEEDVVVGDMTDASAVARERPVQRGQLQQLSIAHDPGAGGVQADRSALQHRAGVARDAPDQGLDPGQHLL